MESLSNIKDVMLSAPLKSYRETCSSALGLSANTFTYNAVAACRGHARQGIVQFVVATSSDSLIWIDCSGGDSQRSITRKHVMQNAHKGITCLRLLTSSSLTISTATLMTAGRDGLFKLWDVTSGTPIIQFETPNKQPVSAIAHFANAYEASYFAAGTELFEREPPGDVAVYVWALPHNSSPGTKAPPPIIEITESHTDTITNLMFHASPVQTNTEVQSNTTSVVSSEVIHLISSSTDGLVTVINPNISDEDDSVQVVLNNRNAVQHTQLFTGADRQLLHSGHICTISQDEKLAVHAVAQLNPESEISDPQTFDLRSELKCDYAIGLFEPQSSDDLVLAVGAYREETTDSPHVDLWVFNEPPRPSEKPVLTHTARLHGAHGEEIVRDVWFQDWAPFILTCGEDGMVRVWDEVVEVQSKIGKTPRKERKKAKEGGTGYKPY